MDKVWGRESYIEFLKDVAKYLTKDCDINVVDKSFLLYISKDEDKLALFKESLPKIKEELNQDLDFFMESDPAIYSREEVVCAYPGYKAIACYRIAHILYESDLKLCARIITELAHSITGIDIHPAASISSPFFIDHGTGIVIGETTIIESGVKLYQGVTLGALSLSNIEKIKNTKRHPTIKKNVTIYSCASILGDVVIGEGSIIGANVFLTESVNSGMKVTIAKPILVIKEKK